MAYSLSEKYIFKNMDDFEFQEVQRESVLSKSMIYKQKSTQSDVYIKEFQEAHPVATRQGLIRAAENMARVADHPAVCPLIGIEIERGKHIMLEYAPDNLERYTTDKPDQFADDCLSPIQKLIILYGIADIMAVLHAKNIIHRSLKPLHILLTPDPIDEEIFHPLLNHFYTSKQTITSPDTVNLAQSKVSGDIEFIAPEVISQENYDTPLDVFAYGIILYQVLTDRAPFEAAQRGYLVNQFVYMSSGEYLKGLTFPEDFPRNLQELIMRCIAMKPEDRPTFADIVKLFRDGSIVIPDENSNPIDCHSPQFVAYAKLIDDYHAAHDHDDQNNQNGPKAPKHSETPEDLARAGEEALHHHPKDYAKARELFNKAADGGSPSGLYNLGQLLLSGKGGEKNFDRAYELLQRAADLGDGRAQYALAQFYIDGPSRSTQHKGPARNLEKARELLENAAKTYPRALYKLGSLYGSHAFSKPEKTEKTAKAEKSDKSAKSDKSEKSDKSAKSDKPNDYARMLELYHECVERGCADGHYGLGVAYAKGQGVEKDTHKAVEELQEALEGKTHESSAANYLLGKLWVFDLGKQSCFGKAAAALEKAANSGHAKACVALGTMFYRGKGVPVDYGRAAALLQRAADKGEAEGEALLAELYESGKGVPEDKQRAYELYSAAAEHGNAEAAAKIAAKYQKGSGVKKSRAEAMKKYAEAERLGSIDATVQLGRMALEEGPGLPEKDIMRAGVQFLKASQMAFEKEKSAEGLYLKGMMLLAGIGCEKNVDLAKQLLQQAKDKGYAPAAHISIK